MGKAKPRPRGPLESTIQEQIVEFMSAISRKYHFIFFAVPNEAMMSTGKKRLHALMAKFKRMGLTPGVSDLVIGHRGRMYCMELKSQRGRQSDNQKIFEAWARSCGVPYEIVRSLNGAIACLKLWGIV
jgi:hypothetical protein